MDKLRVKVCLKYVYNLCITEAPKKRRKVIHTYTHSINILYTCYTVSYPHPCGLIFFFKVSMVFLRFSSLLISFSILSMPCIMVV